MWNKIRHYPKIGLVLLAYVAFVALGLPDGLLGVAWPSIRGGFSIPLDAIGMLLGASVAGYMTSSFLSGTVISRLGVGKVLAGSCALTGLCLIGYTVVPVWWMMVFLGVFAGLGAGWGSGGGPGLRAGFVGLGGDWWRSAGGWSWPWGRLRRWRSHAASSSASTSISNARGSRLSMKL